MPLPVVNDVWLTRLVWRSSSTPRPAVNNLYFRDTVGAQSASNLLSDFNASALANQWLNVLTGAAITQIVVTDLSGSDAGVIQNTGSPANLTGAGGTDPILQGACVVSAMTARRGPAGRGRIYLPWIAELQQTAGVLNSANIATMQTAWNTFFTSMVAAGWQPCIVNYEAATYLDVTNYVVRPNMKTQRRRALR